MVWSSRVSCLRSGSVKFRGQSHVSLNTCERVGDGGVFMFCVSFFVVRPETPDGETCNLPTKETEGVGGVVI